MKLNYKAIYLKAVVLIAFAATISGCSHTGTVQMSANAPRNAPLYGPSMSAGAGVVQDHCGPYKFSDPVCNPALSAAGGGSN